MQEIKIAYKAVLIRQGDLPNYCQSGTKVTGFVKYASGSGGKGKNADIPLVSDNRMHVPAKVDRRCRRRGQCHCSKADLQTKK